MGKGLWHDGPWRTGVARGSGGAEPLARKPRCVVMEER